MSFQILNNNNIHIDYLGDNTYSFDVSNNLIGTLQTNTWYYLVFVRDIVNNAALYIGKKGTANAVMSSSGIIVKTYGSSPPPGKVQGQPMDFNITDKIGSWAEVNGQPANSFLDGYLSNLCITSGALYDPTTQNTISIPTTPFT